MMPDGKGGELANPWRLDCVIVSHQPIKTVCSYIETNQTFMNTAATGLFCWGGKIESRLLKFCQSHATPLSGMAKCDLAKLKQPAVTFCLLIKIVRPRQWKLLHAHILSQDPGAVVEVRIFLTTHHDDASDSMYPPIGL